MASPPSLGATHRSLVPSLSLLPLSSDTPSGEEEAVEEKADDEETPNTASIPNNLHLWTSALARLPLEDQAVLTEVHVREGTTQNIYQSLEDSIKAQQLQEKARYWKATIAGRSYFARDVISKMVEWLRRFKEIGDVAANFDPVHAALPWAGFRYLLEVRIYLLVFFLCTKPFYITTATDASTAFIYPVGPSESAFRGTGND